MIKYYTISLILCGFMAPTVLSQNVSGTKDSRIASETEIVQEALQFSNVVTSTMEEYIRDALPPAAKAEGENIFQSVQEGLTNCESFARKTLNIAQYKVCSSSLFRDGMSALGELQPKYRPLTSGASRMSLF